MRIIANDITIAALTNIRLGASVEDAVPNLDHIRITGLPGAASISEGERLAGGVWKLLLAQLADARFSLSDAPKDPLALQLVPSDAAGEAVGTPVALRVTVEGADRSSPCPEWTKKVGATALVLFGVLIFVCWRLLYQHAQDVLNHDWCVSWEKPPEVVLQSGPITFWYDPAVKILHHRGPIDADLKQTLLKLALPVARKGSVETPSAESGAEAGASDKTPVVDPSVESYIVALDQLAFESNSLTARYFVYLLSIAGLSGVLGSLIRSFANFIFLSTERNELNLCQWWPWYVLRPPLAFLLGLMAVLLVQGKLFVPATDSVPSGTVWWMALSMLAGFAADEFAQRLRLVGQALFGKDKGKDKGGKSDE